MCCLLPCKHKSPHLTDRHRHPSARLGVSSLPVVCHSLSRVVLEARGERPTPHPTYNMTLVIGHCHLWLLLVAVCCQSVGRHASSVVTIAVCCCQWSPLLCIVSGCHCHASLVIVVHCRQSSVNVDHHCWSSVVVIPLSAISGSQLSLVVGGQLWLSEKVMQGRVKWGTHTNHSWYRHRRQT